MMKPSLVLWWLSQCVRSSSTRGRLWTTISSSALWGSSSSSPNTSDHAGLITATRPPPMLLSPLCSSLSNTKWLSRCHFLTYAVKIKEAFWETDVCTFSCLHRCRWPKKRLFGAQTKTKWSTYDGFLIFPSWFHTFIYTWTLKDDLRLIKSVLPVMCSWCLNLIFMLITFLHYRCSVF